MTPEVTGDVDPTETSTIGNKTIIDTYFKSNVIFTRFENFVGSEDDAAGLALLHPYVRLLTVAVIQPTGRSDRELCLGQFMLHTWGHQTICSK
jgi:hypothetical protein